MKCLHNTLCLLILLVSSFTVTAQVPVLNSYPQAVHTIYLDFDGQTVSSPYWTATPFYATPATLSAAQISSVFNRVAEDFRPFNLNITTDSTVFLAATPGKRQRIIITSYSTWYGNAGGAAYTSSFRWATEVPGFVFANLLAISSNPETNAKRIAEAVSHETGHTLGLDHQRIYNSTCGLTSEYNPGTGSGEISWAPIMGSSYSRNITLWHNGTTSCNTTQDELQIIAGIQNGFGYRTDDIGSNLNQAPTVTFNGSGFATTGVINTTNDTDVFRFNLPERGNLMVNVAPNNYTGGYNIDMEAELLSTDGAVLKLYNPSTSVSAVIDTTLDGGTYFVRVRNSSNAYAPNYGMLGNYTVSGTFISGSTLPIYSLNLSGRIANEKHELDWSIIADEPIDMIRVEVSTDGRNFTTLQDLFGSLRHFVYQPLEKKTLFYRLYLVTASQLKYYSNIVSLRSIKGNGKFNLLTNVINSNTIVVNSNDNYHWRLIDRNGRQLANGRMASGSNRISAGYLTSGMYFFQVIDGLEISTEKLVKQ